MTKTAFYLLLIASGLVLLFFILIICTWFFRFFSELTIQKVRKQLEEATLDLFNAESKDLQADLEKLKVFVNNSTRKETLIDIIISYGDDFIKKNHELLMDLYEETGIKAYLLKRLTSNSVYIKSLACRHLGELRVDNTQAILLSTFFLVKNNDVQYNVLLALAKLSDKNGLIQILTNGSENLNISYRAVVEIITAFNGSKEDLFKETIDFCDNYIKEILIKAAADFRIEGLRKYCLDYLKSDYKNLRIACLRALGALENPADEEYILNMLDDKDWEVRAAAAKSLEKLGTSKSFTALGKAAGDSEWWVRHNAARTLILIPGGQEYATKIINGDDKFAREAVVHIIEIRTNQVA